MLWQNKQTIAEKLLSFAYQINPKLLAEDNVGNWTNLGYWTSGQREYSKAACSLATKMGDALQLNSTDQLLDIGCGYGASLEVWTDIFQVQHLAALELQQKCCAYVLQKSHPKIHDIFQQSIFSPKPLNHRQRYNAVISIDATYHYRLEEYLQAISNWMAPQAKVGFHLLIKKGPRELRSQQVVNQEIAQQLAWAKINLNDLLYEEELLSVLNHYGYTDIKVEILTTEVLQGFVSYIHQYQKKWTLYENMSLAALKIKMTAKLCQRLLQSDYFDYVQITAKQTT